MGGLASTQGCDQALSQEQVIKLKEELTSYLYCKSVQQNILKEFGMEYSISGVCKLLKRMDFVYRKPKLIPSKANPEEQSKSAEQLREIIENIDNIDKQSVIYFMDGVHPTHNTGNCYGWIQKGEEFEIPANSGRQRININGAMNAKNPTEVIIDVTDLVNAQSTERLIKKILRKNKDKKIIYIVSDNARYYRNNALRSFIEGQEKIKWIFLPTYSPNLNLIERLWKFLKKKIINGFYYDTFDTFKEGIDIFFKNIKMYRQELYSLMSTNFHLFDFK